MAVAIVLRAATLTLGDIVLYFMKILHNHDSLLLHLPRRRCALCMGLKTEISCNTDSKTGMIDWDNGIWVLGARLAFLLVIQVTSHAHCTIICPSGLALFIVSLTVLACLRQLHHVLLLKSADTVQETSHTCCAIIHPSGPVFFVISLAILTRCKVCTCCGLRTGHFQPHDGS